MSKKRIVITGIGVVSSIGIGKQDYWNALSKGQSGIGPITLFNTNDYSVNIAGEATHFDPKKYFSKRELINFDRATELLLLSSKLALEDAQFTITEDNTNDVGVSVGTTFGSLHSLSEFDKESVVKGPQLVNPSRFPNTVANLPSSQVSIYFNIKGFNVTLSTGMCSSLDAIDYAIKRIELYDKKAVLASAVEEMCEQTFLGFYKLKGLSGSTKGQDVLSAPFDRRRNGMVFGEGAGTILLEDLASAKERKANIIGEVFGISSNFDPYRMNRYNPKGTGMVDVMNLVLEKAQIKAKDIDYICSNANSTQDADRIEAEAIHRVFGKAKKDVDVSSIKSMIGDTYSAAGSLATIASVGAIQNGFIPPTINYSEKDQNIKLNLVVNQSKKKKIDKIMINTFSPNGSNSSLIIGKYNT